MALAPPLAVATATRSAVLILMMVFCSVAGQDRPVMEDGLQQKCSGQVCRAGVVVQRYCYLIVDFFFSW